MIRQKILNLMLFLAIPLAITACGGPVVKNPTPVASVKAITPIPEPQYNIQAGDNLEFKFFYNPELNEAITVRPDGRVSLQLVGEVTAAGRTPSEFENELKEKYANFLATPEVTVIVRSFSAHKIYVDGEVNKPGVVDLNGRMTTLQSIIYAGGLKQTARVNEVVLIRRGMGAAPQAIPVDLEKVIDGTDITQDVFLAPYDIVYVPRSSIANANLWVEQYLRNTILVLPQEFFLYYSAIKR